MLKTAFLAALLWLVQCAVNFLFALVCADWFWHVHSGFGLSILALALALVLALVLVLALALNLALALAYWLWFRHICHGKNVLAMAQAYGDFQERCHSLSAFQAAWIDGSA